MGEWNKIESEVMRLDNDGDFVEGVLKAKGEGDYDNKKYTIKTTDGKNIVLFGTTVLDDLMQSVNIDQEVKIVNIGEKPPKKKGQNPMRLFDVFVK